MRLLAGYLFTPFYYLIFGVLLVLFHPMQAIALKFGGNNSHSRVVCFLNKLLLKSLGILGAKISYSGIEQLPGNRPLIIVANHQSFFDIIAVVNGFSRWQPKFVSKVELARNIPSISYNLRHGGSALIDRSKGSQAIREIHRVGQLIENNNYAVCIFPEGTRNRFGKVGNFQSGGLKSLLKASPSSLVVPFVIDGHSRLMEKGYFPLRFGTKLKYKALSPIDHKGRDAEDIVAECENLIREALGQKIDE